jgi:hypothetical protein
MKRISFSDMEFAGTRKQTRRGILPGEMERLIVEVPAWVN